MLKYEIKTDTDGNQYIHTSYRDKELLSIPRLNKGTAFTLEERQAFGLIGKLPHRIETLDEQVTRAYAQFQSVDKLQHRNAFLNRLLNYNQILFYKFVLKNITEMLPTIYTPMVGDFVKTYSRRFTDPRGLYISYQDQDKIEQILDNRTNKEIKLIVVTDGESVLGIGDQGVGSIAISIAKLMVYTVFGAVDPDVTLPIVLDVGTNNETLLKDPYYLGWRHTRIQGEDYNKLLDKFIAAVKKKFPHVFLHWEDFGRINAHRNLISYRDQICSFNDDIQGTGIVALAALISASHKTKRPLHKQRIAIFGAGSAGMGVTENIFKGLLQAGLSEKEAHNAFYIVDKQGLLTEHVNDITPAQRPFVCTQTDIATWQVEDKNHIDLLEVVRNAKPTVLIGTSAKAGAFNEEVIRTMAKYIDQPVILPLSNPNEQAEATPENILEWTQGKALIATGSPFSPVTYKGKVYAISQCNNYLAFPGLGLGIISVAAKNVSDSVLLSASNALGKFSAESCDTLLPTIDKAGIASQEIALAVANTCINENNFSITNVKSAKELIEENCWEPRYLPYLAETDS